jgi:hypothetical protein
VVTGLNGPGVKNIQIPSFELTLFEKRIQGGALRWRQPLR